MIPSRSERQLMEQVHLNIAHRWFIGYDLHEPVPDHSSMTKIRERYGLETFHQFFEHIVTLCAEAGLVWGEELYFDGTKEQANADIDKIVATNPQRQIRPYLFSTFFLVLCFVATNFLANFQYLRSFSMITLAVGIVVLKN